MKIILRIIAIILLIGGILGLIKGFYPQADWLSFRFLLGAGSAHQQESMLLIERIYGIVMALLEVLTAALLLISPYRYIKLAIVVVGINALGCAAAVLMGDMFAIVSLILRLCVIIALTLSIRKKSMNSSKTQDA